jgi:outer membrane protein assembly factor BamB
VPFVRTEAAAVVATQAGQVVLSRTAPFSQAVPECVHLLDLAAVTPFSWSGTSRGGDPAAAAAWVREQCGLAALRSEPAGLPVRWAHPVPGRVLVAAPAVYGHKVLVPLRDIPTRARRGGVCALSDATGEEEWCHYTPTSVEADLRVVRGTLIVTEVTGDVWGVSPGDGAVLWTSRLDEAVESRFVHHLVHVGPIDDGGRAYYCFQGGPFGLDARDGRVVWQGEAYGGVDAFNHSRGVIVRDALYCAGFHGGIYRYDLHASTARKEQVVKGFRTLADLQVKGSVWALGRAELVRLDPDTWLADKLFSFDWLSLPAGPIVRDDFAIVPDGVTGVMRLPLPAGKREWRAATRTGAMAFALNEHEHGGTVGSPVLYGSRLFVAGVDGVLYELDVSTGEERRGLELGAPLAASPAVRADSLYVADWAGMVFAVDLAD